MVRTQSITLDPGDCPGSLPTYFEADLPVGKMNLPFSWAGMHPRANKSQQSSLFNYQGNLSKGRDFLSLETGRLSFFLSFLNCEL